MIPLPSPDQWDDIALAVAAVITAIGTLTGVIFAWVKWQRELRAVRAELSPSPSDPSPLPARAIPAEASPSGTTRDVVDSSHALLLQLVTNVEALVLKDSEIRAWGESEHARIEERVDGIEYRMADLDARVTDLEEKG